MGNDIIKKIVEWAEERGILKLSDPTSQFLKTVEEVGEISSALAKDDIFELEDAIGDTVITLVLLAKIAGTDYDKCVNLAYNNIKHRTGSMVNGIFVKDEKEM